MLHVRPSGRPQLRMYVPVFFQVPDRGDPTGPSLPEIRIQYKGFQNMLPRLALPSGLHQDPGHIVPKMVVIGIHEDRLPIQIDGVMEAALLPAGNAQAVVKVKVRRILIQEDAKDLLRLAVQVPGQQGSPISLRMADPPAPPGQPVRRLSWHPRRRRFPGGLCRGSAAGSHSSD